ncbi:hypothetical protein [Spectribacter hydrogenoxidans]|uniref:Uncharacterized protein n=1 Tax=Spectribacter hydrogenoxidans TaxID=3075608 RepID=A0ABU3C1P5_9GAMM|nr:hypothetical protein [Salinisphaera sp. W335]MDT0635483.1 hypothetical protein [Salinisphaera sp. W335]
MSQINRLKEPALQLLSLLVAGVLVSGCVATGEPRMRTLSEFQYGDRDTGTIRDSSYQRQGDIQQRGDDYIIRDNQYRVKYRLDRRDDGSYTVRDSNYQPVGEISAPDAGGTRRVRDGSYRNRGQIEIRDGETIFRDSGFRQRLRTDIPLE